ncbi:glycosyltransferase family 34 protein [Colletotrichum tofieldiae]|nr:glycosyltransferase family 34 protein [Colletotrichum tofieldiae]
MSLSRSPSPIPGGGWASPGLTINTSGRSSPSRGFSASNGATSPWETAKMRTAGMNGYPSFSTQNQGFFTRHMRRISSSLPRFNNESHYAEKEKLGRGSWAAQKVPLVGRIRSVFARMGRKMKLRLLILLLFSLAMVIFYNTPLVYHWRRHFGGGQKYVIILAANVGGGVMEWKGAREWAIERDSVRNKKKYANRWGYDLEIVDMSTKKRYAHEWRESWEKVDFVRSAFRKYPKAEWYVDHAGLDIGLVAGSKHLRHGTFVPLQNHIFNDLNKHVYRDINEFNPLNISHPFTDPYLDEESRSPVGDGRPESINLILSQDCSGFNLGSFFVKRGNWADRMLDVWWDPVAYEQKHMEARRPGADVHDSALDPQAYGLPSAAHDQLLPPGACSENGNDTRIHYDQKDRDFVVNMAGCEWGRDCWGEMYNYRELSYYLNRNPWERFKEDLIAVLWFKLTGQKVKL